MKELTKEEIEERKSYIGKTMEGFIFGSRPSIRYIENMDFFIGLEGVIHDYIVKDDSFRVHFKDRVFWYPAEETIQNIAEEGEIESRKSYVGKPVVGFRFYNHEGCTYEPEMNDLIGKVGFIQEYCEVDDRFLVCFKDDGNSTFWYPAKGVIEHIPKENLIGYKLKEEYEWMDKSLYKLLVDKDEEGSLIDMFPSSEICMTHTSTAANEARKLGILDVFFEGVYEETKEEREEDGAQTHSSAMVDQLEVSLGFIIGRLRDLENRNRLLQHKIQEWSKKTGDKEFDNFFEIKTHTL